MTNDEKYSVEDVKQLIEKAIGTTAGKNMISEIKNSYEESSTTEDFQVKAKSIIEKYAAGDPQDEAFSLVTGEHIMYVSVVIM